MMTLPIEAPAGMVFNAHTLETDLDLSEYFTCGECWSLALALHEVTGWPLAFVFPALAGSTDWRHVGAVHPTGRFVDWGGFSDEVEFVEDFGDDALYAWLGVEGWRETVAFARGFVPRVLGLLAE